LTNISNIEKMQSLVASIERAVISLDVEMFFNFKIRNE